jgi:hypothetical protein
MTKIADIYNAIVVKIETALPTFTRLPNPYALDENTALLMRNSYGIAIGGGTNTEKYVSCLTSWRRDYTIGLVSQVVNTENDTLGKAIVEKNMIDNHRAIFQAFEIDSTLSGICTKAVVVSDTGIEYIAGNLSKFIAIEINISVDYQE